MFRKVLLAATALAAMLPGTAGATWYEGSSKHFIVYADDSLDQVKAMTTKLERFDKTVRVALGLKEPEVGPDARVIVFVLPQLSDVQKMMGGSSARNVAGFYRSDFPTGSFAFVPKRDGGGTLSARAVLQHEYTHHIMYSSFGDVVFPGWFSEGFAELFATAKLQDDGSVVIGAVPVYRSYGIDRMNDYPVESLVKGYPDYRNPMATQIFYGRAWLLTHYMMFDATRAKALGTYIAAINDGKSRDDAQKLLGITPSLDVKLNAYGARPSLPGATFTADKLKIGEVSVRALTPGEAAVMPMRMRSHNGVDPQQAKEVVDAARRAAAPYPNDPGAQNELAEAEFDAGNYDLSEAAADRVLAADPKSVHGLIYKGMAQMELLKKAGNTDPTKWSAARRWFLAANKVDSLYSYPIQLYFESFANAKQAPSRAAKDGLLFAYRLAPQNLQLRFDAAHVLLGDNRLDAARVALEPIAYSERPGPISDMAKKALGAIDKGGAAAALAILDAPPPKSDAKQGGGKDDGKKGS